MRGQLAGVLAFDQASERDRGRHDVSGPIYIADCNADLCGLQWRSDRSELRNSMYDNTDPRSSLAAAAATSPKPATEFAGVEYARFHDMPPAEESVGVHTWVTRGQNFVLAYSEASTDCRFERSAQHDEFAVLSPDPAGRLEIEVDGKVTAVPGASLVFMPPGKSMVRLPAGGRLIRLFTMHATDVVALCSNAQS